jgi:hypothetical protein
MTAEPMQRAVCLPRRVRRTHCCWASLLLFAFALAAAWTSSALAQSTEGSITGTVTTADGALIANATVTVVNVGTQLTRTVRSDSTGNYTVTVKMDAPRFSELQDRAVSLAAQQTVRIDGHLTVAGTTSVVTVTSQNPVINLEMPSISSTVTAEALNDTSSNLLGTSNATGDSGLLF